MYYGYKNKIIDWLLGINDGWIPIGCFIILFALIIVIVFDI